MTFSHIQLISIMFLTDVAHSSEEEKSKALPDGLVYLIADGLCLIPGGLLVAALANGIIAIIAIIPTVLRAQRPEVSLAAYLLDIKEAKGALVESGAA